LARSLITGVAAIGVGIAVAAVLLGMTQGLKGRQTSRLVVSPPDLWVAEMTDGRGMRRETSWICADEVVRGALTRAVPEINGAPCLLLGRPLDRADLFAGRCSALGQRFSVNVARDGDVSRDFRVRVSVRPLETQHPGAAGTIHYRKVGPCPPTWRNGDSARMAGTGNTPPFR
jgi:hypothetical protein